MSENKIKILGEFLNQGEFIYKNGIFKGSVYQPEKYRIANLSFSEDCIDHIQFIQYIKSGLFSKDICFSIILTDGRELQAQADEQTYRKIYEKSLSSRKTPTVITEKPFGLTNPAKMLMFGVCITGGVLIVGGISFCSSSHDSRPPENVNVSLSQNIHNTSVIPTSEACHFSNFDITSWKDSSGDGTYTCSSNHVDVSPDQMDGSLPNYLMYAAQGSHNHVAQVKVYLYVNNTAFRTSSTKNFIEACNLLSSQISGEKIPKSLVDAIKKKTDDSHIVNGFSVTIETEIWENGNGYKQNCIVRPE